MCLDIDMQIWIHMFKNWFILNKCYMNTVPPPTHPPLTLYWKYLYMPLHVGVFIIEIKV